MVVVIFTVICTAAVLFLLRFLFAIESEIRSARIRQSAMVKLSVYRLQPFRQVGETGPEPMLVYSNTSRQDATLRPAFTVGPVACERSSQYKKA
jgi:hypothetical protein